MNENSAALLYHEPSWPTLLILISFLFFVNLARPVSQRILGAGLIGQILVGLIYGLPLANILPVNVQEAIVSLGYVGLCTLVFQGGIESDLSLAKKNLGLSLAVAFTGLLTPICLSLLFIHLVFQSGYTLLQAFTAGAALSSTSLGTTFNLLSSVGLHKGRLGAVLTTAAVVDDVVALILLQVIVSLSGSTSGLGWTIGRPILASSGLLVATYLCARFLLPKLVPTAFKWLMRLAPTSNAWAEYLVFMYLVVTPSAFIAVAGSAGTSVLLGTYLAGLTVAHLEQVAPDTPEGDTIRYSHLVFAKFISPIQTYLLEPFFFASIGFAISIKQMFTGTVIWQGLVYSVLMFFSKAFTGSGVVADHITGQMKNSLAKRRTAGLKKATDSKTGTRAGLSEDSPETCGNQPLQQNDTYPPRAAESNETSLVIPSLLLGLTMVARGEIGLLIAGTARGESENLMPNQLYLVAVWAILLNTIIGPLCVGMLIKRIKRRSLILPGSWGLLQEPADKND